MRTAQWHLDEAERLLELAEEADKTRDSSNLYKKFGYPERAQAHIALATAAVQVAALGAAQALVDDARAESQGNALTAQAP